MSISLTATPKPSILNQLFGRRVLAASAALALTFGGLGVASSHAAAAVSGTIATTSGSSSGSGGHTLVIGPDGFVYASGSNNDGQLGIGTTEYTISIPRPVDRSGVLAGKTIVAVAAGTQHSLALDSDGKVYGWGRNSNGQLGSGSSEFRSSVPVAVDVSGVLADKKMVRIAAGPGFSLAVDEAGKVYGWGENSSGQLGTGSGDFRSLVPVAVDTSGALEGKRVVQLGAGGTSDFGMTRDPFVIALLDDGSLVSWGGNSNGQLADGTTTRRTTPVAVLMTGVLSSKKIRQISVGPDHVLALDDDGVAYGWGRSDSGQLGNGDTSYIVAPVIAGNAGPLAGKTLALVAAGSSFSMFLDTDGKLYGAGRGDVGQLGNGSSQYTNSVVEVQMSPALSGKNIVEVVAGNRSVLVRAATGEVFGWGGDFDGQLGSGLGSWIREPIAIDYLGALAGKNVVDVRFGITHALYLNAQGVLYASGENGSRQLGDVNLTHSFTPIVAAEALLGSERVVQFDTGVGHSLVLTEAGEVFSFGLNNFGQAGVGNTVSASSPSRVQGLLTDKEIVAIAAGGYHSLALDSDGVLYAWGYNFAGQLGDGTTGNKSSPVVVNQAGVLAGKTLVDVQAGDTYTMVRDSDGKLYAWGHNNSGQLGNGNTSNQPNPVSVSSMSDVVVTGLSVGMYHSLALDALGQAYAWGANIGGALGDGTTSNRSQAILINPAAFGGAAVSKLSAGTYISFAIDENGRPYGWGTNGSRNLAVESIEQDVTTPSPVLLDGVLSGKVLTHIAVNKNVSIFARDTAGVAYGWGQNQRGELGIGYTLSYSSPILTRFEGVGFSATVIDGDGNADGVGDGDVAAAPYAGPMLSVPGPMSPVRAGSKISITGSNLAGITSLRIAGIDIEFELAGDSITFAVPETLAAATYDLVIRSDSGVLTIQQAIAVARAGAVAASLAGDLRASTRMIDDGSLKVWVFGAVGEGKVQIMLNGLEVAWVNAASADDPKLRDGYLVRTLALAAGKNVVEVYVDGKRVERRVATYLPLS